MPKSYQSSGKSTREMAKGRRSRLVSVGLLSIGAIVVIYLLMSNSTSLGIGGLGILVLIVAMRLIADQFDNYARRKEKTIRRADRGALAEEEIGDLLDQLDDDFVVIHDVESPYGNIDHIVISQKSGIFLLETKSHRGTVTTTDSEILVNGKMPEKDFVGQALKNSFWLREETERLLKVKPWITAVVVFSKAFVKFGRPVKGVRVVNQKFLIQTLQAGQADASNTSIIWTNRERLASHLTGQELDPVLAVKSHDKFCLNCGKKLVEKTAKSGSQAGKRFWVCPDYPQCKTAIPIG